MQVSQQVVPVATSTSPVPGSTAGVYGNNDLEGSMHAVHDNDGTRADAATATLERCYGQASCMPEGAFSPSAVPSAMIFQLSRHTCSESKHSESTRVLHRSHGGGTCINGTLPNWMWHVGLLRIVE